MVVDRIIEIPGTHVFGLRLNPRARAHSPFGKIMCPFSGTLGRVSVNSGVRACLSSRDCVPKRNNPPPFPFVDGASGGARIRKCARSTARTYIETTYARSGTPFRAYLAAEIEIAAGI